MGALLKFIFFILFVLLWISIDDVYKTSEVVTLLVTLLLLIFSSIIYKVLKNIDKVTFVTVIASIVIIFSCIYFREAIEFFKSIFLNFSISVPILFLFLSGSILYLKVKDKLDTSKSKTRNDKDYITSYSKIENNKVYLTDKGKELWRKLDNFFIDSYKKESSRLLKKNKLQNSFSFRINSKKVLVSLSKVKHIESIFHSFQESIIDIEKKKEDKATEFKYLIGDLIYQIKFLHYKTALRYSAYWIKNILEYFLIVAIIISVLSNIYELEMFSSLKSYLPSLKINHIETFMLGILGMCIAMPLSYLIYGIMKFSNLKAYYDSQHYCWDVLRRNIIYYTSSFLVILVIFGISLSLIASSGIEYDKAFHFLLMLLLPIMDLKEVPSLISSAFSNDIVISLIFLKIFFLIFIILIVGLIIKHMMEIYIEVYDSSKESKYAIPPEFAKFFSYLMISIFSLILLYGTIFINYPSLEKEYTLCERYMTNNVYTIENCDKYKEKFVDNKNLKISKESKYCGEVLNLDNIKDEKLNSYKYCSVGMSLEHRQEFKSINSSVSSSSPTISDYLPLSIFLTLFGVIMMISTKNLLENYFIGLSTKINPPYEEGERIKINGGEMLSVESIGFRASTFYGISSHAHLVIPHRDLANAIITNYTKPTLDYRERITIYIPDTELNENKNIPREAEKILLLAAFISTGVKYPKFPRIKEKEDQYSFKNYKQKKKLYPKSRIDAKEALLSFEEDDKSKELINNIFTKYIDPSEEKRKMIFISTLYKLMSNDEGNNKSIIMKKIIVSILAVLNDYERTINESLPYSIDEYNIKRKTGIFNSLEYEKLNEIAEYLVNINYYYFALAEQLWSLKDENKSEQQKNIFDNASLEILDVPRVTSVHRRDIEGAFWEVSLLVTVELAEQSDEIIQHINMFVDELWEKFNLPKRCKSTIE